MYWQIEPHSAAETLLMLAGNQAAPSTPWPTDGCVASHVEWRGLSASSMCKIM